MSTPSTPLSPNAPSAQEISSTPQPLTPKATITRTVAIIKNHALDYRLDIETRIHEASFEIVKERQIEFDTETDPEYLEELFGDDAASLAEGPVLVYVLERRRAVEVWSSLMGNRDPEIARQEATNSLRALYGKSLAQNGLMGSPDTHTAELQIAALFASSPPFPSSELPPDDRFGTMQSVSSSVLEELQKQTSSNNGSITSSRSTNTSRLGSQKSANGFRARTLPPTHDKPDIVPRTTRAAALRAGVASQKPQEKGPRTPLTKEETARTFANIPGHKRAETIAVASTAVPVVAPRMTKAAALRLGIAAPAPVKKKLSDPKATFEGVPGHKRRETISVASVVTPTVAPRTNRSAALRATKDSAPPTSYMFRGPSNPKVPGLSRSNSQSSLSPSKGGHSRPSSQMSMQSKPGVRAPSRTNGSLTSQVIGNGASQVNGTNEESPKKARPRPASIAAPTIAPRTNKSAALRAAKKAEEEAAAAAAAAKKNRRMSARPAPRTVAV